MSIDIRNLTMEDVARLCGLKKPTVACPSCGDELELGYLSNTVYREGDEIKVCDACQEVDYSQCPGCGKWVHKDEFISGLCDNRCFDKWLEGRRYA